MCVCEYNNNFLVCVCGWVLCVLVVGVVCVFGVKCLFAMCEKLF